MVVGGTLSSWAPDGEMGMREVWRSGLARAGFGRGEVAMANAEDVDEVVEKRAVAKASARVRMQKCQSRVRAVGQFVSVI